MLKDYRKNGLGDTASTIADALRERGLAGTTVLELGCGFGALTLDLVRRGASSGVGIDLSPHMLQLANSLAAEAGLARSVSFELGDGAVIHLPKSDVVILDAVLCCYPDVATLVDNSSSAAGRFYAISIPDDSRIATRLLRLLLPLQVLLRRGGFKFFIHDTVKINERLRNKGFKLESRTNVGWIWSVFLFAAGDAI